MQARKAIPVVIPYYKNIKELEQCVAAVNNQINVETKIFIRDNTEDNILYTAAVNCGIKKFAFSGNFDFILVLTQDAYLAPDALHKLAFALEADEKAGIAAPIQINRQNQIQWAGSLDGFPRGKHSLTVRHQKGSFYTYWVNGACFLARIRMIREIGLLDENMMHIFSDVDFSFTARLRGWEAIVVPDAICQHYLKSSISPASAELRAIMFADQIYFASKWLNGDAYRALSYEGEKLSMEGIEQELIKSSVALKAFNKRSCSSGDKFNHRAKSLLRNLRGL